VSSAYGWTPAELWLAAQCSRRVSVTGPQGKFGFERHGPCTQLYPRVGTQLLLLWLNLHASFYRNVKPNHWLLAVLRAGSGRCLHGYCNNNVFVIVITTFFFLFFFFAVAVSALWLAWWLPYASRLPWPRHCLQSRSMAWHHLCLLSA
jgi:hypothetical protein